MNVPTDPPTEGAVLDWFERALERDADQRHDWLAAQDLPEALRLRVQRLLDTESSLGGFLEGSASAPETSFRDRRMVGTTAAGRIAAAEGVVYARAAATDYHRSGGH